MAPPPPAIKTAIGFKDWLLDGVPIRIPNGVQNQGTAPFRIDLEGGSFDGEWDEARKVFVIRTGASVLPAGDVDPTPDTVLIRGAGGEGRVQWIEIFNGDSVVGNDGAIRLGTTLGPILQAPNDDSTGQAVPISRESPDRWIFGDTEKVVTSAHKGRDAIIRFLAADASEKEHSRLVPEVSGLPAGPVTNYSDELGAMVSDVIPSGGTREVWENPASPVRRSLLDAAGYNIPSGADYMINGVPVQKTGPRPEEARTTSASTASTYPTYVDLLTISYTATRTRLLINADAISSYDASGAYAYYRLTVDGVTVDEVTFRSPPGTSDDPFGGSLSAVVMVAAGARSVKLQWCVDTGSGATLSISGSGLNGFDRAVLRITEADAP